MLNSGRANARRDLDLSGVDDGRRRSLGIYYTPDDAAKLLAEWAIRSNSDAVLEPSFGGCSMLSAALERLRGLGCRAPANQLFGYDVDPEAFNYLERTLGGSAPSRFLLRDFLSTVPGESSVLATVALGNPPFVSYHRMDESQRATLDKWRQKHGADFSKVASLWAYFLIHSLSFLAPRGRLAFILPTAFSTADYGRPVLQRLTRHFDRVIVFSVRDQLFLQAGARERTVVLLAEGYVAQPRAEPTSVERYSVLTLNDLSNALQSLKKAAGNNAVPISDSIGAVVGTMLAQPNLCSIDEAVTVSIGEVVGDTAFFVKTLGQWSELGIGPKHLVPLVTRTKQVSGLAVREKDINTLYSSVPMLLRVQSKRHSKAVERYLESYPKKQLDANRTFQKRYPWHLTSYRSDAAAFIGSLSYNAPRVLQNLAGISCANGLYQIRPKQGLNWAEALSPAVISTIGQLSAELVARTRGPGAMKLEPSDVRRLVVPSNALDMKRGQAVKFAAEVDKIFREHGFSAAARYVDQTLLVAPGILSQRKLTELQHTLRTVRSERIAETEGDAR